MDISLVNKSKEFNLSVSHSDGTTKFLYPCPTVDVCTSYKVRIPKGLYSILMCGGNGGVPSKFQENSMKDAETPYAGGCSQGILRVDKSRTFFITLGGHGEYTVSKNSRSPGGFNGGGRGNHNSGNGCSGGGGASDLRAEVNDVYHRILVAGGGGGGDDLYGGNTPLTNDGRGGSGGGIISRGWYQSNRPISSPVANETFGFSFGQGEFASPTGSKHPYGSKFTASTGADVGGAGGGWFGGFASNHYDLGAGGGSSFALTNTAIIPNGTLEERSDDYSIISTGKYAFLHSNQFLFTNAVHQRGVWYGNGFAEITSLNSFIQINCASSHIHLTRNIPLLFTFLLFS